MPEPEIVKLRVDGLDWQGWTSCRITRSVDSIAGGFALGLTDRWEPGRRAMPLAAGMACEILTASAGLTVPLIKGYIDRADFSLGAATHDVAVSGRDASGDLVDCSAVHQPGQWVNLTADQLAARLAEPFGVPVSVADGVDVGGPFPSFKIEPGESALDALKRALRQRELLCLPDGRGGLSLAVIGRQRASTALEQGVNILSASAGFDTTERYSDYIVQGQRQGGDQAWGAACSVLGVVRDEAITRYRPYVLRAEQQGDAGYMRRRAVWEKTLRAAKSTGVTVTVQGWRQDDGSLWPLGGLISVSLPWLGIEQDMCLTRLTLSKTVQGGTTAALELKDPDVYQPEPARPGGSGGQDIKALLVRKSREAFAAQQEAAYGG